jgi:hypothetical protein
MSASSGFVEPMVSHVSGSVGNGKQNHGYNGYNDGKGGIQNQVQSQNQVAVNLPVLETLENEYSMNVGKRPKLYDLNKNYTNFEIEFMVQAENPTASFFIYILPQDQLDKTDVKDLPMKAVEGRISGKVSNNNDVYQNYFIILRSDSEEDIRVSIRTKTAVLPLSSTSSTSSGNTMETTDATTVDSTVSDVSNNVENQVSVTGVDTSVLATSTPVETRKGIFGRFRSFLRSPAFFYVKIVLILLIIGFLFYSVIWKPMFSNARTSSVGSHQKPVMLQDEGSDVYGVVEDPMNEEDYGLDGGDVGDIGDIGETTGDGEEEVVVGVTGGGEDDNYSMSSASSGEANFAKFEKNLQNLKLLS